MAQGGFAVAAFRDSAAMAVRAAAARRRSVISGVLLSALRSQPPEGGPFVVASVDDEFFLIARLDGRADLADAVAT